MALESGTYISDLNASNPVGATDKVSTLDDHVRLLKSTVKNTFPNIDGAVTATEDQLNVLKADGDGLGIVADIAALTAPGADRLLFWDHSATAAKFLALASGELAISDTTLGVGTNIPKLNAANTFSGNNSFGGTLSVTGAATFSSTIAVTGNATIGGNLSLTGTLNSIAVSDFARLSQANTFTNSVNTFQASGSCEVRIADTGAGTNQKIWTWITGSGAIALDSRLDNGTFGARAILVNKGTDGAITSIALSAGVVTYGGIEVGFRDIPSGTFTERGKVVYATGGSTLNTGLAAGSTFAVYNDSASPITITQGSGLTLRLLGTTSTGNRTIAARGWMTVHCKSTTEYLVSGPGVS